MIVWGLRAGESDESGLTKLGVHQVRHGVTTAFAGREVPLATIRQAPGMDTGHAAWVVRDVLREPGIYQVVTEELTHVRCAPFCSCETIAQMTDRNHRSIVGRWLRFEPEARLRRTQMLTLLDRMAERLPDGSHVLLIESAMSRHPIIELVVSDEEAPSFPCLGLGDMIRLPATLTDAGLLIGRSEHIPCVLPREVAG